MPFTGFSCRHAHYQAGNTPLTLVWKDENCSQYVIDTDSKGQVPNQQQVHLHFLIFVYEERQSLFLLYTLFQKHFLAIL